MRRGEKEAEAQAEAEPEVEAEAQWEAGRSFLLYKERGQGQSLLGAGVTIFSP